MKPESVWNFCGHFRWYIVNQIKQVETLAFLFFNISPHIWLNKVMSTFTGLKQIGRNCSSFFSLLNNSFSEIILFFCLCNTFFLLSWSVFGSWCYFLQPKVFIYTVAWMIYHASISKFHFVDEMLFHMLHQRSEINLILILLFRNLRSSISFRFWIFCHNRWHIGAKFNFEFDFAHWLLRLPAVFYPWYPQGQ